MAINTDIFTIAGQRNANIAYASSTVSGRDKQYAFDQNLNTWWEPTSTATQDLIVDLQTAQPIEAFAVFVRNFDTDLKNSGSALIELNYSDTGILGPWTAWPAVDILLDTYQTVGDPLLISPNDTAETHRYWQFVFSGFDPVIQVAHLFLYQKRTISAQDLYPHNDQRIQAQDIQRGPGGRLLRSPRNVLPVWKRRRSWLTQTAADITALENVHEEAGGREQIIIFRPNGETPEVVELRDKRFMPNQIMQGVYRPSINIRTIPFAEAGSVF